jgi:hypothetical protein
MDTRATNREELLNVTSDTLGLLQQKVGDDVVGAAASVDPLPPSTQRDIIVDALVAGLDFARLESGGVIVGDLTASEAVHNIPYLPSNQALSLIQSALDEFLEDRAIDVAAAFDPADPGWLSVAFEKLKALFRGKHKFTDHGGNVSAFREPLADNAVVALFSDWGTGEDTAARVMTQIRQRNPTHAIHLGDVYYSGTEREIRNRFLAPITTFGPPLATCRYRALNANHEMYSGGHAYFDLTLPTFGQAASYFNLQSTHFQLIGLDSGYEDHGLKDPQATWLAAQLQVPNKKNVLLTHHQLFSPFEDRAFDRKLHKKATPLLGGVHAWLWGHEHKAIVFGEHLGIHARCIGHGAIPERVPYGNRKFPNIPVIAIDERAAPGGSQNIHGFALLTFQGAQVRVEYIDEFGATFHQETL